MLCWCNSSGCLTFGLPFSLVNTYYTHNVWVSEMVVLFVTAHSQQTDDFMEDGERTLAAQQFDPGQVWQRKKRLLVQGLGVRAYGCVRRVGLERVGLHFGKQAAAAAAQTAVKW